MAGAQRLGTETGFQNSISVSAPKEESLNQGVCCRFDFATVLRLSITCKHWRGSLLQFFCFGRTYVKLTVMRSNAPLVVLLN